MRDLFERQDIPDSVRALFVPNGRGTAKESMVVPLIRHFNTTYQLSLQIGIATPMFTREILRNNYDHETMPDKFMKQHIDVAKEALSALKKLGEFLVHPDL